jgi:histidinol phosphatase-like PHP family hydrolase
VRVLGSTPIDIMANFTFLPACIADQYASLWTRERMERVIDAAVEHGVAIEINDRYRIPSPAFIRLARDAGARFSFGSNQHGEGIGKLDYPVTIAKECGLDGKDIFVPERKNRDR